MERVGMRVLVCGDRHWMNKTTIRLAILEYTSANLGTVIIHGGARGADKIAGEIAKEYGLKVEEYPAEWNKYGKGAGPIRNQRMLDEGKPDMVLAFHNNINESKGTKDMINRAKKANVRVVLIKEENLI